MTSQKTLLNRKKKLLRQAKIKKSPEAILNSRLTQHHCKNLNRALNLKKKHVLWVVSVVIEIKKSKKKETHDRQKSFYKEEKCFNKSKIFQYIRVTNFEDG